MLEDEVIADSEDEGSFAEVVPGSNSHSSIVEDSFRMEFGKGASPEAPITCMSILIDAYSLSQRR